MWENNYTFRSQKIMSSNLRTSIDPHLPGEKNGGGEFVTTVTNGVKDYHQNFAAMTLLNSMKSPNHEFTSYAKLGSLAKKTFLITVTIYICIKSTVHAPSITFLW